MADRWALAALTNNPESEVSVRLYRRDAEGEARFMKSLHTRVYTVLAIAAILLGIILCARPNKAPANIGLQVDAAARRE